VALYVSEIWKLGRNEERFVNLIETWSWRRMLKIKWTDRIMNDEVFRNVKEERLFLKIRKNTRHLRKRHIVRHNEPVVNILEGAISGIKQWEDIDYNT
jgi:hypothetical protein